MIATAKSANSGTPVPSSHLDDRTLRRNGSKSLPGNDLLTQKQAKALQSISRHQPRDVGLFRRCFLAEAAPRQAIRAKCKECTGGSHAEIEACSADNCPLWRYRPGFQRSAP